MFGRLPAASSTAAAVFGLLFLLAHEVPQNVDGYREYDRGVLFVPYAAQSLKDREKNLIYLAFKSKQGYLSLL